MPPLSLVPTANPMEPWVSAGLQELACLCVSSGMQRAAKPGCRGNHGCWGLRVLGVAVQGFSQPHGPSVGHSHTRSLLAGALPKLGAARQRRGWEPVHAKWLLSVSCCAAQHSPPPHTAPSLSPQRPKAHAPALLGAHPRPPLVSARHWASLRRALPPPQVTSPAPSPVIHPFSQNRVSNPCPSLLRTLSLLPPSTRQDLPFFPPRSVSRFPSPDVLHPPLLSQQAGRCLEEEEVLFPPGHQSPCTDSP